MTTIKIDRDMLVKKCGDVIRMRHQRGGSVITLHVYDDGDINVSVETSTVYLTPDAEGYIRNYQGWYCEPDCSCHEDGWDVMDDDDAWGAAEQMADEIIEEV